MSELSQLTKTILITACGRYCTAQTIRGCGQDLSDITIELEKEFSPLIKQWALSRLPEELDKTLMNTKFAIGYGEGHNICRAKMKENIDG